jgi:hypothetical protein
MSSGGVNRTAVGNSTNQALNSTTTTGAAQNSQLQGILGGYQSNALQGAGDSALSGYNNLAMTGGYSPEQVSALKSEGSDAARSSYATASDAYSRALAASGGYGPSAAGFDNLSRGASNAASKAAVSTDAAIAQSQVQNQLAGLAGQASLYGTNQQNIQQILASILGNTQNTESQNNTTLQTQLGIAKMPGTLTNTVNGISALLGAGGALAGGLGS